MSVAAWPWRWWHSGDGSDGDDCDGDVMRWRGVVATKWG